MGSLETDSQPQVYNTWSANLLPEQRGSGQIPMPNSL